MGKWSGTKTIIGLRPGAARMMGLGALAIGAGGIWVGVTGNMGFFDRLGIFGQVLAVVLGVLVVVIMPIQWAWLERSGFAFVRGTPTGIEIPGFLGIRHHRAGYRHIPLPIEEAKIELVPKGNGVRIVVRTNQGVIDMSTTNSIHKTSNEDYQKRLDAWLESVKEPAG